jgi:hypothetical protein
VRQRRKRSDGCRHSWLEQLLAKEGVIRESKCLYLVKRNKSSSLRVKQAVRDINLGKIEEEEVRRANQDLRVITELKVHQIG